MKNISPKVVTAVMKIDSIHLLYTVTRLTCEKCNSYQSLPDNILGARDFSSVGFRFLSSLYSGFSRLRRSWLRLTAKFEDVSAFGQHRKFPPHAKKTSGTEGSRTNARILNFTTTPQNMADSNLLEPSSVLLSQQ